MCTLRHVTLPLAQATDIVGYTFRAENYCPDCLIERMVDQGHLSPAAREMAAEVALDQHAEANAIDRDDEWSFDTDDFPKVIFRSHPDEVEGCGGCGTEL